MGFPRERQRTIKKKKKEHRTTTVFYTRKLSCDKSWFCHARQMTIFSFRKHWMCNEGKAALERRKIWIDEAERYDASVSVSRARYNHWRSAQSQHAHRFIGSCPLKQEESETKTKMSSLKGCQRAASILQQFFQGGTFIRKRRKQKHADEHPCAPGRKSNNLIKGLVRYFQGLTIPRARFDSLELMRGQDIFCENFWVGR